MSLCATGQDRTNETMKKIDNGRWMKMGGGKRVCSSFLFNEDSNQLSRSCPKTPQVH